MRRGPRLSRRTLLRGLGGIGIALPWLEAMHRPAHAATSSPKRLVITFGGLSCGIDNDATNLVKPTTEGFGYVLPPALQPLAAVQQHLTVVSGLEIPLGAPGAPIPPGGRSAGVDSFHFHSNPLLTGNAQVGDSFDPTVTGPSADQVAAAVLGSETMFASLTYRAQAEAYVADSLARGTLSFREDAAGVQPVAPYTSPRAAFDSLFTTVIPADPAEAERARFELEKRRSILDLVDRRLDGLVPRLSAADQQTLERHFDEIRALELRLDAEPVEEGGACVLADDPGDDPPVYGSYGGEDLRARAFADLLVMALGCDLTRAATLMYTTFQSVVNLQPIVGVPYGQHEAHHFTAGSSAELSEAIRWHMGELAYLIEQLAALPEGDGTVLDHTALVMLLEGGHGPYGQETTGFTSHTTHDMVALVAGHAGGLVAGQHLVAAAPANHPANVLVTALNAVDVPTTTLGQISGEVVGLR